MHQIQQLVKFSKKSLIDNINKLYENEYLNNNDSVMIIVNESISETVQKAIDDYNIELQNQLEVNGLNEDIMNDLNQKI